MSSFIDLTGQKFGNLIPIKNIGKNKHGQSLWLCKCCCGNQTVVTTGGLRSGNTKSCGCLCKEINLKHGHTKRNWQSKTYVAWKHMKHRCYNKNNPKYKDYGGRGITVCDRWLDKENGFKNFLKDIGEIPEGKELDRIHNNKLKNGYSPENCQISTRAEQMRNTRRNNIVIFEGEEICIKDLSYRYKINPKTLDNRIKSGLSIQEALSRPVRKYNRKKK